MVILINLSINLKINQMVNFKINIKINFNKNKHGLVIVNLRRRRTKQKKPKLVEKIIINRKFKYLWERRRIWAKVKFWILIIMLMICCIDLIINGQHYLSIFSVDFLLLITRLNLFYKSKIIQSKCIQYKAHAIIHKIIV